MTDREQQIEEMAVIGCVRNPQAHTAEECAKCDFKQGCCNAYRHAEALYNAGYRKTDEITLKLDFGNRSVEEIVQFAEECMKLTKMFEKNNFDAELDICDIPGGTRIDFEMGLEKEHEEKAENGNAKIQTLRKQKD